MASEYAGYSVRPCRGHWHVTVDGEDVGDSYPTWQAAWAGIADLHRSLNLTGSPTPAQRLVDETDAGAVPGCTTECAKLREENERLRRLLPIDTDDMPGERDWDDVEWMRNQLHMSNACFMSARDELASLRADAEAVRAVEEWRKTVGRVVIGNAFKWEAIDGLPHIEADSLVSLGRALMARRQEEGQTDNG